MIEESCLKFIEFYFNKANDFAMDTHFYSVIMSLSTKCAEKFRDMTLKRAEDDFFNMKHSIAENFVWIAHLYYPQETEARIQKWILEKVLSKSATPTPADEFILGSILKLYGIQSLEYELSNTNAVSITTYLHVLSGIAKNAWMISEETLKLILIVFVLSSVHRAGRIKKHAMKSLSAFFENYCFVPVGCTSTLRFQHFSHLGQVRFAFLTVVASRIPLDYSRKGKPRQIFGSSEEHILRIDRNL